MCDALFVYGTLMRRHNNPAAAELHRKALFIAEGRVQGQLFQLKGYPGLALSKSSRHHVHGEVYGGIDAALWAKLDAYEECDMARPSHSEYLRVPVTVTLIGSGESQMSAATYVYNRPTQGLRVIKSGRYLARN